MVVSNSLRMQEFENLECELHTVSYKNIQNQDMWKSFRFQSFTEAQNGKKNEASISTYEPQRASHWDCKGYQHAFQQTRSLPTIFSSEFVHRVLVFHALHCKLQTKWGIIEANLSYQ